MCSVRRVGKLADEFKNNIFIIIIKRVWTYLSGYTQLARKNHIVNVVDTKGRKKKIIYNSYRVGAKFGKIPCLK